MSDIIKTITVGQWMRIMAIPEDWETYEKNRELVGILRGLSPQEVGRLEYSDFLATINKFNRSKMTEHLKSLETKINQTITLPSGTYHLLTNYNKMDASQIMQMIDLSGEYQHNPSQGLDKMIAVLLVERKFDFHFVPARAKYGPPTPRLYRYQYDDTEILRKADEVRDHVRIVEVWAAFVFFWNLWNVYEQATRHYLREGTQTAMKQVSEILVSGSDGSRSSKQ